MGRIEGMFGLIGLALVVLLLVAGLLRRTRDRGRTGGMDFDGMGADDGSGETEGPSARPGIYPDFRALLQGFVLPRREAQPGWGRLDGAEGVPGRSVALFDREGTVYAVNGESRFDALLAVREWMDAHPGEDPLVVRPTKSGRGRLTLRPELAQAHAKGVRIETE